MLWQVRVQPEKARLLEANGMEQLIIPAAKNSLFTAYVASII